MMPIPKPLIYLFLATILLTSCSKPDDSVHFSWSRSEVLGPPPNSHDEGTEDLVVIEIHNFTKRDVHIPKSRLKKERFRITYGTETLKLQSRDSYATSDWIILAGHTDSITLTTPIQFPQFPWNDTLDMNRILTDGIVQVCLPMDSTPCEWVPVEKAWNFHFRRGPAGIPKAP